MLFVNIFVLRPLQIIAPTLVDIFTKLADPLKICLCSREPLKLLMYNSVADSGAQLICTKIMLNLMHYSKKEMIILRVFLYQLQVKVDCFRCAVNPVITVKYKTSLAEWISSTTLCNGS